ncbi:MAG TPA: hypothetical protein VEU33_05930, partial [Archangium sp.]|nr:hypothetical protein [Archangium sp.]
LWLLRAARVEGRVGTLAGFNPDDDTQPRRAALARRVEVLTVCLAKQLSEQCDKQPGDTTP